MQGDLGAGKTTLVRSLLRLAEGELDTRVGEPLARRRDEFGDLARDFDHMAGRLQEKEVMSGEEVQALLEAHQPPLPTD